jgi:hypothetical protein
LGIQHSALLTRLHRLRSGRRARSEPCDPVGRKAAIHSIAPGFTADVVAVEGDPLQNIEALFAGVRWVMKEGTVVTR